MYRLGVVGCGVIWEKRHSKALLEDLGKMAGVRAVFDPDPGAASKAAAAHGARVASSWRELVDDPEIDIVVSCAPPHVRAEHAVAAANRGKHLLLEKPMAREAGEAKAIEEAVRRNGVHCVVAFMRSVNSSAREIALRSGEGGELGRVTQFFHHDYGPLYPWIGSNGHWMFTKAMSGGPLMDYSCHFLEFALAVFKTPVTSVWSDGGRFVHDIAGDDTGVLALRFGNQGSAYFSKSWTAPRGIKNSAVCGIVTDKGMLNQGPGFQYSGVISGREMTFEGSPRYATAYETLFDAIEGRPHELPDATMGRRVTEVLCAAFESQESGRRLDVCI